MPQPDLAVIVPSRGRPHNVARLIETCRATIRGNTQLLVVTDPDDPEASAYEQMQIGANGETFGHIVLGSSPQSLRLGGILNYISYGLATETPIRAIGFMGDDHLPRTDGWDRAVIDALNTLGPGSIVYGNDLLQGERLPTAAFMTADIIQTLGYMVPAGLQHMFADDAWKAWGEGAGRLRYMPEVVIEHMHPAVGKAQQDSRYSDVWALMEADSVRWEEYRSNGGLVADIAKLRGLL